MEKPYEKGKEPEINTTLSSSAKTRSVSLFPQRSEIKHTATPVTDRGRDNGVHGVEQRPKVGMQLLHDAALSSALRSVRVLAFSDWTPY